MNTDKIKRALKLFQEAVAEKKGTILRVELSDREAEVLRAICQTNITVPKAVVRSRYSTFPGNNDGENEVAALLSRIKDAL